MVRKTLAVGRVTVWSPGADVVLLHVLVNRGNGLLQGHWAFLRLIRGTVEVLWLSCAAGNVLWAPV